jgi:hypothetical protein
MRDWTPGQMQTTNNGVLAMLDKIASPVWGLFCMGVVLLVLGSFSFTIASYLGCPHSSKRVAYGDIADLTVSLPPQFNDPSNGKMHLDHGAMQRLAIDAKSGCRQLLWCLN